MSNYNKINSNICIECDGKLINTSTLTKELKECESCGMEYYRPDDMGPGSWNRMGNVRKKRTDAILELKRICKAALSMLHEAEVAHLSDNPNKANEFIEKAKMKLKQ